VVAYRKVSKLFVEVLKLPKIGNKSIKESTQLAAKAVMIKIKN
jgi:hypothetical protein